jgi:hypothetical protein
MKPSVLKMAARAFTAATLAGGIVLTTAPCVWAEKAPAEPGSAQAKAAGQKRVDRVEARIASLHEKLHITQTQEPAWKDFVQVMRDNAQAMKALLDQRAQQVKKVSAVSELRSHAEMSEAYAAGLRKLVPVFETLYNSMPDDQKMVADKVMTYHEGRRRHRGK